MIIIFIKITVSATSYLYTMSLKKVTAYTTNMNFGSYDQALLVPITRSLPERVDN